MINKLMEKFLNEQGNALLYVLFLLLLTSILGVYAGRLSLSDNIVSHSLGKEKKALNTAEAGIEYIKYYHGINEIQVSWGDLVEGEVNGGYFEVKIIDVDFENPEKITIESIGYYGKARYKIEKTLND